MNWLWSQGLFKVFDLNGSKNGVANNWDGRLGVSGSRFGG